MTAALAAGVELDSRTDSGPCDNSNSFSQQQQLSTPRSRSSSSAALVLAVPLTLVAVSDARVHGADDAHKQQRAERRRRRGGPRWRTVQCRVVLEQPDAADVGLHGAAAQRHRLLDAGAAEAHVLGLRARHGGQRWIAAGWWWCGGRRWAAVGTALKVRRGAEGVGVLRPQQEEEHGKGARRQASNGRTTNDVGPCVWHLSSRRTFLFEPHGPTHA